MLNILSYVGLNMQAEVCLWCLLGLVRTIFDATLFKVNANLKQVWQMTMPAELSMPVQRALRTMMSGVMLVQCFTVYVYLAAYIVLLYPVFLEERPTLVLPWLLLAAVRKLLCELTSLALGLGTCLLLGPARSPCIKFVVVKFTTIIPAFYMWMLVFSYYHALKVASVFKTFPAVLPPNDNNYGLELAVRRRRTKSLQGEEQLRKKLVANFYGERNSTVSNDIYLRPALEIGSKMAVSSDTSAEEEVPEADASKHATISSAGWSDIGAYEDWFGSEVMIPRDTDRILEQIVLMLLRIGAYLKKEGLDAIIDSQILNLAVPASWHHRDNIDCTAMNADDTETPPLVGSNRGNMASYLREYPQIFMKKQGADMPQKELTIASLKTVRSFIETEEEPAMKSKVKRKSPSLSRETISSVVDAVPSKRKIPVTAINTTLEDKTIKIALPLQLQTKASTNVEGNKIKSRLKQQSDSDRQSKTNTSKTISNVQKNVPEKSITIDDNSQVVTNSQIINGHVDEVTNKIENNSTNDAIKNKRQEKSKNYELISDKNLNMEESKLIFDCDQNSIAPSYNITLNPNSKKDFSCSRISENNSNGTIYSKILKESSNKSLKSLSNSQSDGIVNTMQNKKNKELPLRIRSNDDKIISNKESKNKLTHSTTTETENNKLPYIASTHSVELNDSKYNSLSYINKSDQASNKNSIELERLNKVDNNVESQGRSLNEDINKDLTPQKRENEFRYRDSHYIEILKEFSNTIVDSLNNRSRDATNNHLKYDQTSKGSGNSSSPSIKNSDEQIETNVLNLSNNNELTHKTASNTELTNIQASINCQNKELPLRILSNDGNTVYSIIAKTSNEYSNREFIQSVKENELTHTSSTESNEGKNKIPSEVNKSVSANNNSSTDNQEIKKIDSKGSSTNSN